MRLSTKIVSLPTAIVTEGCIVSPVLNRKEEITPVYELIKARQDELGLSIRKLGERFGVGHTGIAKNLKPGADPLTSTIVALARVAGVTPTVMFEAFLGKKLAQKELKSRRLKEALIEYESNPEIQEKLAFMVEMFIREVRKLKQD